MLEPKSKVLPLHHGVVSGSLAIVGLTPKRTFCWPLEFAAYSILCVWTLNASRWSSLARSTLTTAIGQKQDVEGVSRFAEKQLRLLKDFEKYKEEQAAEQPEGE